MSPARARARATKKKAEPRVSRNRHPATTRRAASRPQPEGAEAAAALSLPRDVDNVEVRLGPRAVRLTNLRKLFWPALGITKGDLIQYYADVSPWLLPHIHDRAMVMKRYPHGAAGEFFFMKRAPTPRPDWIEICAIEHESGNVIDFPMIQDLPSLLWVINLGCIDLNQWYARCDDVDRPDYVHFDLDPVKGKAPVPFERVRETALIVHAGLEALGMPAYAKTTGSRGIHVYVPIVRGRREGSGASPSASRTGWPPCTPLSSPRSTGSRSARKGGCWWTTTRTRGGAPWLPSTRCARIPRPRSPRP
jgi:bifunctional non-homologous end joining protein LigD